MKLDSAVANLLGVDASTATVSSGSGGCSAASTSKITATTPDGQVKNYFMKSGQDATMFKGEHASLNAIHNVVPSLCPRSYGHGRYESSPSTYFLVTDYLSLGSRYSSKSSGTSMSLAEKLAKLHTTPAPVPEGHDKPMFGFPVTTCCGDTPQDNSYKSDWADFYAENRMRFILRESEKNNGKDKELHDLVEATASRVVPRLLGNLNGGKGVTPVVVHGDLWSGNTGIGKIDGQDEAEEVVFDSSACYAHSELELGICRMFGGFGPKFMAEYHKHNPKTEPVEEYDDRIELYELYHHLNHHALFGGGYRSGAVRMMKDLVRKYG
ncbi:Fructosamine/Ketosamine-3-kinase [Phyllosticta capitalensis]